MDKYDLVVVSLSVLSAGFIVTCIIMFSLLVEMNHMIDNTDYCVNNNTSSLIEWLND